MANSLKIKVALIIGAIGILVLIPLLKSNFNAPVTMQRWRQLEWDDFQGFEKPFTGWAAGISSSVFVEYDSTQQKYRAYAEMHNQYSWKSKLALNSDYVLNHEQYHFNITEYHARKLNEILENQNIRSESQVLDNLAEIRSELRRMQNKYDNETDHSLIKVIQRKWEYQIDSLLNSQEEYPLSFENEKVNIYFPSKPKVYVINIEDEKHIGNILAKYDATFSAVDLDFFITDTLLVESYILNIIFSMGQTDILVNRSFPNEKAIFRSFSKDTIKNEIVLNRLFLGKKSTYWLTFRYPMGEENKEIYQEMGEQFFNSLKVLDE